MDVPGETNSGETAAAAAKEWQRANRYKRIHQRTGNGGGGTAEGLS